jgi:adenylate cyclase
VLGWQRSRAAARERDAAAGFDDVLAASDARYRALWEEREALRRSLLANRKISGYLAHDLVERILADPEVELSLGGTRVEAAVLFADLVGFTPRCEAMAPERVVSDLNVYFRHVDGVIDAHGGIIDKRIGDAVMVVFVVRNGDVAATHARAVACARAILGAVGPCNEELARAGSPPLQVRVGVAAGPLVQGNMGSSVRLEYTVIGDTVNLAARLEGLATPGRALVLASMVEGEAGERRTVNVKGKVQAVEVVEVWGFA